MKKSIENLAQEQVISNKSLTEFEADLTKARLAMFYAAQFNPGKLGICAETHANAVRNYHLARYGITFTGENDYGDELKAAQALADYKVNREQDLHV